MEEPKVAINTDDLCGESPIWDEESQSIYWTDIVGHKFHRYSPAKNLYKLLNSSIEINGFAMRDGGGFIITNSKGVWRWDGWTEPELVLSEIDGCPCRMNDCIADPAGRLISGTWHYDPQGKYELGKLISVERDGRSSILDKGIHGSNGLAFSVDQKTLYFTDSIIRTIYAYDYDVTSGTATNRRVWVKLACEEGLPDGMTVDSDGFVWSAQWYGGCIVRYDPEGHIERRMKIPAKQVSSLTFGGRDLSELYITTAGHSKPMPIMPPGYDYLTGPFGGALYRMKVGIRGMPEFKCRF